MDAFSANQYVGDRPFCWRWLTTEWGPDSNVRDFRLNGPKGSSRQTTARFHADSPALTVRNGCILFMGATHDRLLLGAGDFLVLEKFVISYNSFLRFEPIRQRCKDVWLETELENLIEKTTFLVFSYFKSRYLSSHHKPAYNGFDGLNDMQFAWFYFQPLWI